MKPKIDLNISTKLEFSWANFSFWYQNFKSISKNNAIYLRTYIRWIIPDKDYINFKLLINSFFLILIGNLTKISSIVNIMLVLIKVENFI